jgi:predicted MFS family arabinose efflux permease
VERLTVLWRRRRERNALEREVRDKLLLLQLFKLFLSADLMVAIWVPFYQQNGMNQTQIFASLSAIQMGCLVCEVPAGWIADRYGYRRSLIIGSAILATAYVVYGSGRGFSMVLVGEVITGIGFGFISGTDKSMAYDLLKEIGREEEEGQHFEAIGMSFMAVGAVLGALAGPLLAAWYGIYFCVWLQLPIYVLLIVVALCLRDPVEHTAKHITSKQMFGMLREILRRGSELRWVMFYSAVITSVVSVVIWLRPVFCQQVGISLEWFGVLLSADLIGMALIARLAGRFTRNGYRKVFWLFVLVPVVSCLVLVAGSSAWWGIAFIGPMLMCGLSQPVFSNYVNRLTQSEIRATVHSIKSMVFRLFFTGTTWMVGRVVDGYSLSAGFGFSAVVFGALAAGLMIAGTRTKVL